jgi:hypothetical protein
VGHRFCKKELGMPRKTNEEWSRRIVDAIDEKNRELGEGKLTELSGRRRAITADERRVWHNVIDRMEKQLKDRQNRQ